MFIFNGLSRIGLLTVLSISFLGTYAFTQETGSARPVALASRGRTSPLPPQTEGQRKIGISDYEKMVATDPGDALAANNLGALYVENGRFDEGLALIKKAADDAPDVWNYQLNTSIAYTQAKDYDDAMTYARRAQKVGADQFTVRQQLCGLFLATQITDAVKCFEELSTDKQADAMDVLGYGEALIMIRDFRSAEDAIRRSLEASPRCAQAHNDLGIAAFHLKRFGDAVNSIREAVTLDPDNAQFRFNLAIAQMAAKDRAGAISQYRLLKTSDPQLADRLYQTMFAGQVVQAGP